MRRRLLWGGLAVAGLAGVLLLDRRLDGHALTALAVLLLLGALEELFALLPPLGREERWLGRLGVVLLLGTAGWAPRLFVPALGLCLGGGACFALRRPPREGLPALATVLFALLYLGVLPAAVLLVRHAPEGWAWVVLLLGTVKTGDSGAYFVGRWRGRRRLAPRLSPAKTWEGLAGGLATAALVGALGAPLLFRGSPGFWGGALLGALFGAAGVVGDLWESWLKRGVGRKDSGRIPGVGGMLDLLDSVLLAAPVALAAATWLGR